MLSISRQLYALGMADDLKTSIAKQRDDTVIVVVILLKGFVVAAVAYFVTLCLTQIFKYFGNDGVSTEALKFFDECSAAITYLVVVGNDLLEYVSR